ncbi:MAG: hypothetical protein A3H27_04390 [Acidobacteria bacterium RIFCSPLOWO2_02_FULL_59_13]|nr:MAG: hypothetical protein A3H27_04390 [Acidobacteria bacterium RIFCSPLOWO2_02_FULL_59_13]
MVIEKLRTRLNFPSLDVPRKSATSIEEIEAAAEYCRNHWDLGLDRPVLQVGRIMERAGVIIVPHVIQTTKVDAFSRNGPTTIIFLNQAIQSTSRWNFDIGHECGHLVLHSGIPTGTIETERAADRFASAFLMPRKAFAREFTRMGSFSWKYIFDLKRSWQTSAQAIVRRAYDLGLLGAVGYRRAFKYMSMKGWRTTGEPAEPAFQQPELLSTALSELSKVGLTLDGLCRELHFTADTFQAVTGVSVPAPEAIPRDVIPFPTTI